MKIEKAWVIKSLDLASVKISKEDIKSKWEHLKDISNEMSSLEILLLIGADMPHLHFPSDVVSRDKNDSIGVLTKLGCVIMGRGGESAVPKKVSSNLVISSRNTLENTVQRFWEVDSYGTAAKNNPSLLPLHERRALDILETTCTKLNGHYFVGLLWKEDEPHYQTTEILSFQE